MKFFKCYFDDNTSLDELQKEFVKYEQHLKENRNLFDEQTYIILKDGVINDYTIEKFSMNIFWNENDKRLANIEIILEYDDKRLLCIYEDVEYFSLQKDFDDIFGFDAILISECIVQPERIEHHLYFVEKKLVIIKCKKIKISHLSSY